MNQEYITNLKGLLDKYAYSDYEKLEIRYLIFFLENQDWKEKTMNQIIKQLLENKIPVELFLTESGEVGYRVGGFYKSGTVDLVPNGDGFIAHQRYNKTAKINDISDLVFLNHDWWQMSKNRYEGWAEPDSRWLSLLVKYDLVKVTEKVVKEYK